LDEGFFVINVADEIWNDANEKVSIEPYSGTVLRALDEVDGLVHQVLTTSGRKVVIHCAMGMERSVLAVVWYLHCTGGLSLDEAYDAVRRARPIALDRRAWIKS
jgi:protein-tyrosine phosphatase